MNDLPKKYFLNEIWFAVNLKNKQKLLLLILSVNKLFCTDKI